MSYNAYTLKSSRKYLESQRRDIMQVTEILKQLEIQEGNLKAGYDFGAKSAFIIATIKKINDLQVALDEATELVVL